MHIRSSMSWAIATSVAMAVTSVAAPGAGLAAAAQDYPKLPGHWEKIPEAPWGTLVPVTAVVDGDMLVVEWIDEPYRMLRFDPEARTWTSLDHVPEEIEIIGATATTDDEVVVFDKIAPDRIAAYDPDADTWRWLPASPLTRDIDHAVAGDGRVFAIGIERSDGVDVTRLMAAYDPGADTWTQLLPPAGANELRHLIWSGPELLAISYDDDAGGVKVEVFDLDAETWSDSVPVPVGTFHAQAIWAGDRLVWSGTEDAGGRADASFDVSTMTSRAEDYACPVDTRSALWTGELIIGTSKPFALDPVTGECYRLPGKNRTLAGNRGTAVIGDRVIFWSGGGAEEGVPDPFLLGGNAFVLGDEEQDLE